MRLVTGGYAQGKLDYVLEAVGRENCRILECVSEEDGQRDGEKQTAVFNHFHLWVRERLRQGGNPEEELNALLEREPDCIIISDEIGCGIVPLEPEEREYRERTGRILTALASRAGEVDRVLCGIGKRIK